MADITVTPDTFELALTQYGITLPGASHVQSVETFELVVTAYLPKAICSFPCIERTPSHAFSDEPDSNVVLVSSTASGYPVLNPQFTFDGRIFTPELRSVIQADKLIVMAFYEQHKDKEFPWYNDQDDTTYTVCFMVEPRCRLDGRKDLWRIQLILKQTSP